MSLSEHFGHDMHSNDRQDEHGVPLEKLENFLQDRMNYRFQNSGQPRTE